MDRILVSSIPARLKMTQGYGPFVSFCVEVSLDFGEDGIGIDAGEATVITTKAILFTVDGTGTTWQIQLYAILRLLSPSHEPGSRMCSPPYGNDRSCGD